MICAVFASGCPNGGPKQPTAPEDPPKIATTERGPRGARLVFLSEKGVRLAELTKSGTEARLDSSPNWSPDGKVIIFSRSTGETLERGRLHLIAAKVGSTPSKLSEGTSRQRDARWFPDGRSIVFADDTRGNFDLYRQRLVVVEGALPRADGPPERLTQSDADELSPTVSPDGKTVVYMEITGSDSRLRKLSLESGEKHALTAGPIDVTPAFHPEKPNLVAYAARADGRNDMDLFLLDVETLEQTPLPAEERADLTGPVWSVDGRHLFATAVARSVASGEAILSSVVVLDTDAPSPVWRALHDPAFTESRIGVALAPRVLLPSLIDTNLPYAEALVVAIEQHLIDMQNKPRPKR